MTPDMLTPSPDTVSLGRVPRTTLASVVTARAYGSAGTPDLEINGDVRGAKPGFPGHGLLRFLFGGTRAGASSFEGLRQPERQFPGAWYNPGGVGGAFGGGWADGTLTVRDRHVMTRHGHVRNPEGGGSSMPSPDMDGLSRAEYQMVNTTESWQLGTDHTAMEDNQGQHNSVPVVGTAKKFPLGQQDGTETPVWGPPIGEWREYGTRGPKGMHGPAPDVWDPNWIARPGGQGAAASGGRGRLVEQGAPGMQPGDLRVVYGGVPHGLHSPTAQSTLWTGARSSAAIQMTAPRLDRPASSKIAGQSMSQTFPPEASFGQSRAVPRQDTGRQPGLDSRFRGRS